MTEASWIGSGEEALANMGEQIRKNLEEVEAFLNELAGRDIVITATGGLGGLLLGGGLGLGVGMLAGSFVQREFRQSIEQAMRDVAYWTGKILEYMSQFGNPWSLRAAADAWDQQVGGKVTKLAAWFDVGYMDVDDHWTGPAAKAYSDLLPGQRDALTAMGELTKGIKEPLYQFAEHISNFWLGILTTLLATIAKLIKVANRTLTPDILSAPGEAIEAMVAGFLEVSKTLADSYTSFEAAIGKLHTALNNNAAFPRSLSSDAAGWPGPRGDVIADPAKWEGEPTDG